MVIKNAQDVNSTGYVEDFEGDGYTSLAIIYTFSAAFNVFASPVIAFVGAKWTMVLGSLTYIGFVASFFYLNEILLYSSSALLGIGAAMLWPSQVSLNLNIIVI